MDIKDFAILSFGSIFVIVDPIATIPTFLAMTETNSLEERIRMARLASIITFFVLFVFSFAGRLVLGAFGITMPAFEIAGGVVLMKIALDMLQARRTLIKETPEEEAEGVSKEDIAVTPLAVPMLAGPGAITTVVLLASQAPGFLHRFILMANIFLVALISFFVLRLAAHRPLGFSGITLKIITRLMGLLLSAVAVQFILNGLQAGKVF